MISLKLVQLVETHWEQVTTRVLGKIRSDSRLMHVNRLPESELRERARELLVHIGEWLESPHDERVTRLCASLGRRRCEEGIPLHEVVLARFIIKNALTDFVRDHAFAETPLDVYAEEELERRVGALFDDMIYHVVRGYEGALREPREVPGKP